MILKIIVAVGNQCDYVYYPNTSFSKRYKHEIDVTQSILKILYSNSDDDDDISETEREEADSSNSVKRRRLDI